MCNTNEFELLKKKNEVGFFHPVISTCSVVEHVRISYVKFSRNIAFRVKNDCCRDWRLLPNIPSHKAWLYQQSHTFFRCLYEDSWISCYYRSDNVTRMKHMNIILGFDFQPELQSLFIGYYLYRFYRLMLVRCPLSSKPMPVKFTAWWVMAWRSCLPRSPKQSLGWW